MDNRFYFDTKDNFIIEGQEASHLLKVRRAKVGDKIVGFNGDGYDYFLTIESIGKDRVVCICDDKKVNKAYKRDNITVYLAMLKHDALTTAIDYLAELNVKTVKLFRADYSIAQIDDKKLDKLNYLAMQASKQCERADIMKIEIIDKRDIAEDASECNKVFFAYEDARDRVEPFSAKSYAIIIGPEGGFSKLEVEYFSGFSDTISLGTTILRAEVACASAVSTLKAVNHEG